MLQLLRLLWGKKAFTCQVLPPGTVYASKFKRNQLVVIIDLEECPDAG